MPEGSSNEGCSTGSRPWVMTKEVVAKIKSYLLNGPPMFSWELREKLIAEGKL